MSDAKQAILDVATELGLTIESKFIPWSQSRNKDEKQPSLNWSITLKRHGREVLTTDYMAGVAHCPSYEQGRKTVDGQNAVKFECEHGRKAKILSTGFCIGEGKAITPDEADVIHSLVSDSDVLDCGGFEEWASNLGYDTDSRKAEAIYRTCLEIALKLRNAVCDAGLAKLREAGQDY